MPKAYKDIYTPLVFIYAAIQEKNIHTFEIFYLQLKLSLEIDIKAKSQKIFVFNSEEIFGFLYVNLPQFSQNGYSIPVNRTVGSHCTGISYHN